MKRFHVHLRVYDIESNVRFYSSLFGMDAATQGPDCAQWLLEDPPLVLTISARGSTPGVELLGIQVGSDEELGSLRKQFASADGYVIEETEAIFNGSPDDVRWLIDPQGILWEAGKRSPGALPSTPCRNAIWGKTNGATAAREDTR